MLLWREAPSHAIHEANPHDLIESNHKINQSINQSIKTLLIRDESETRTLLRFTCQLDLATWCTQLECIRLELVDRAVAHLLDRGDRDRRHGRRLLHHRSHTLAQLRNYHDSLALSLAVSLSVSHAVSLSISLSLSLNRSWLAAASRYLVGLVAAQLMERQRVPLLLPRRLRALHVHLANQPATLLDHVAILINLLPSGVIRRTALPSVAVHGECEREGE